MKPLTLHQQAMRATEIEKAGGERLLTKAEIAEYNTLAKLAHLRRLRGQGRVQ